MGAEVLVTSGSVEKLDKAMAMGAMAGANYREGGWVEKLKSLAGAFDVIVDGAAGDGLNELLDLAAPGGRVVLYGATRGSGAGGGAEDILEATERVGVNDGEPGGFCGDDGVLWPSGIRPVVDRVFGLEQGEAAFRWMEEGKQFGKIIVKAPRTV